MGNIDNIIPDISYFIDRIGNSKWKIIKDRIKFHDLTYIYKGKAKYIINSKEYEVNAGDIVYVSGGSLREAYTYSEAPVHCYACNFFCQNNGDENSELDLPTVFNIGNISEIIDWYKELNHIWIEKGYGYRMKSRAIFMIILHRVFSILYYNKSNMKIDSRIKKVKEYIINNYYEDIDIKFLAGMVNLNHVYLGALFKKCTGISVKDYIRRIRINSAESLLLMGGHMVGEVALHCGFHDVYYFSKLYKAYKGYPPSNLLKRDLV